MNLKKTIDFKDLETFFKSKNFTIESEYGVIYFYSPFGKYFGISQDSQDKDLIYLDCNLLYSDGLPSFPREWRDGKLLHDFLIYKAYPILRNIRGGASMKVKKELIPELVVKYLKEKKIETEFNEKAKIKYIEISPYREMFENTIEYKLISFYKNSIKYGIVLKQFNMICVARFKDADNTVFFEYPWFSFCPLYKSGEDYIKTTIDNFLEFIEQDEYDD